MSVSLVNSVENLSCDSNMFYLKQLYSYYKRVNIFPWQNAVDLLNKNPVCNYSDELYEGSPQKIWARDDFEVNFFYGKKELSFVGNRIPLSESLNSMLVKGDRPSHLVITAFRQYLEYMNTTESYLSADIYELDLSRLDITKQKLIFGSAIFSDIKGELNGSDFI